MATVNIPYELPKGFTLKRHPTEPNTHIVCDKRGIEAAYIHPSLTNYRVGERVARRLAEGATWEDINWPALDAQERDDALHCLRYPSGHGFVDNSEREAAAKWVKHIETLLPASPPPA